MKHPNRLGRSLTLEKKRNLVGLIFVLPFIIGFLLFFLVPLGESVVYTFHKLTFSEVGGFDMTFLGFGNFVTAFTEDAQFNRILVDTLVGMLAKMPFILFFSYFIALILNQKFKGRLVARVIFFLPVIMGANVILKMEQTDFMMGVLGAAAEDGTAQTTTGVLVDVLAQASIPQQFLDYIVSGIEQSASIIKESSIQILIFLSALQAIPGNLYEASNVEGATAWESFWKITFPLMLPTLLINIVYTVIDSYSSKLNGLIEYTSNLAVVGGGYGLAAAMNWVYLLCIAVILLVAFGLLAKRAAATGE